MNPDPDGGSSAGPEEAPGRTFQHEGVPWTVHIGGVGVAGTGRFALTGLQLLRFTRDGDARPEREIVTALRDPADLHDTELIELLQGSRPIEDRPDGADNGLRDERQDPHDSADFR